MARIQGRRWCKVCGKKTLHERDHFSRGMGCLLTILTGGLFLIVWVLILLNEAFKPWVCQTCGKGRMT